MNSQTQQSEQPKYGARVYRVGDKLLVKQTVLRGTPPEYVIDEHRERHVPDDDDATIAAAIRDAVSGKFKSQLGRWLGSHTSAKKAKASKRNGGIAPRPGSRPRGRPRKPKNIA